ncbi:MAG: NADH-quinone oxidoreductase subunit J [Egibacteraceae bacterium]
MTPLLAQTEAASGSAEFWVFIVIGALALGSALSMVLLRNAVHAALMLVVNFFAIAVLYATLDAQFLAIAQIIVYAGAIVVLFLFVLMLLGVAGEQAFSGRIAGQKTTAVLLGLALFGVLAAGVAAPFLGEGTACNVPVEERLDAEGPPCEGLGAANADGNVRGVGFLIFTDYVWPFEVTSVLLVVAAIGAIVLGKRREDPGELTDAPASAVPALRDDEDDEAATDADAAGAAEPAPTGAGEDDEEGTR